MFRREEEATIYVWIISSRNLTKNKKIISGFYTENVRVTYTGKDIHFFVCTGFQSSCRDWACKRKIIFVKVYFAVDEI